MTGYIRFVGGPLHNQHRCVRWDRTVDVAEIPPLELLRWPDPDALPKPTLFVTYRIARLSTRWGTLFYEFHLCDGVDHSGPDAFYC